MRSHTPKHNKMGLLKALMPFHFAVGVYKGTEFVIKLVQLGIDKFIWQHEPNHNEGIPKGVYVFVNLKIMFNSISHQKLLDVIREDSQELLSLAILLYGTPMACHYHWDNGSWPIIKILKGANQGCLLSVIFASLVLNRILRPLNKVLQRWAATHLNRDDSGDDNFWSIIHIFAWIDNVMGGVPHFNLLFFCK